MPGANPAAPAARRGSPGPCLHDAGRRAIQRPWASPVPFPEAPSCVSTPPDQVWLSEHILAVHAPEARCTLPLPGKPWPAWGTRPRLSSLCLLGVRFPSAASRGSLPCAAVGLVPGHPGPASARPGLKRRFACVTPSVGCRLLGCGNGGAVYPCVSAPAIRVP